MALVIILSIGAPLCLVVVILGCLNCFMKRKPGFSPFSNPSFVEEGTAGRNNDAFAIDMEPAATPSDESHVTIEPIPDLAPKSDILPPLRPKILSMDKDSQTAGASFFVGSHRLFPRENLTYLNPLGVGWFGQVILSEALRISTGSMRNKVVVKMLKDDASSVEEKQFIDEILPYRHLDHANVIALLGQCTETRPYLYIVEYAPHGDLKTFLQSHRQSMDTLLKKNKLLHFCIDIAAGVACIHRHNFVHCDLSTRACLVMSDYKIKIGDYGMAEQTFKEDYFQSNNELLPIRWMAPDCLVMKEGESRWYSQNYSKASDMWSFGVLLWEVFTMAEQPYDMLTDEAVLQGVVIDRVVSLADIPLRVPFHSKLSSLMNECWKDPAERISIEPAHQILDELSREKVEKVADELDFDQKWNHLIPSSQSRSQSLASEDGSAIALAGSFSSEFRYNLDDKLSSAPSEIDSRSASRGTLNDDNTCVEQDVISSQQLNLQFDLTKDASGTVESSTVNDEMEVKSSVPDSLTPSKKSAQQMTTSTPIVDKNGQDKTPTSFLTALNTPNSQYTTAESFTVDNSALELNDASGVSETQEFGSLTSSEIKKTIQESDIEIQGTPVMDNENKMVGELSNQDISNTVDDFVSFTNNTNVTQNSKDIISSGGPESSNFQELDSSFDIILPSMLDKEKNSEITSHQSQSPSTSSQNGSFDFLTDLTENEVQSVSDKLPASNNNNFTQVEKLDNTQSGLDKSTSNVTNENLSFESEVHQSTNSNPFSPPNTTNPFSTEETTSTSSQDAAIFFNKSEIDASSSLNSSSLLGGWDTSFPETIEPAKDSLPFVDNAGKKEVSSPVSSSDISFLEGPPAVSDSVEGPSLEVPQTTDKTSPESFLSGFESQVSSNAGTMQTNLAPNVDDMFGPASSATFSNEEPKATAVSDLNTSESLTSDPFDFSAFETKSNLSTVSEQQQKQAGIDIFSPAFSEDAKNDNQEKNITSSSATDFSGLDIFTNASATTPETTGLMQGGDLLTSLQPPVDNQVGTVYKCDDSNSFPDQSEEEESGVSNSCFSTTESSSAVPTATTFTSDSCYASGVITDSRNAEEMSSSEEISSRAFVVNDMSDNLHEADFNYKDHHSDSTELEESSLSNNVEDKDLAQETDGNSIADAKSSSSDDSEYNHNDDDTSSTSGSEREYICVNPFDTGQPPTRFETDLDNKENLDPDYPEKDIPFDDLNEQDLKIVSEIYLSKGVKSPRVFEVPTLETIPEHQPLYCVSEEAIPTPSETSSVGHRDDDLFGSDSYEWDDFYGDSLIGKDDTGPEMDDAISQSQIEGDQNNISNWSLDFETDNSHYSSNASTSVLTIATMNKSDSACLAGTDNDKNKSPISNQMVQCLSDSELLVSKNSSTAAIPRSSLVASTLAKHRNRSLQFSSPLKNSSRDKGNFYSLMEDFDDFQLDSSQEDGGSPVNLSDDDEFAISLEKKTHLFHSSQTVPSSSFQSTSFSSPVLSTALLKSPSHASTLPPKKSTEVLAIDIDAMRDSKISSTTEVNKTSSPSMDLLGLGFDPIMPSENSSKEQGLNEGAASDSQGTTSAAAVTDPFDSLI